MRLLKSIYGLEQVLNVWYKKLCSVLKHLGLDVPRWTTACSVSSVAGKGKRYNVWLWFMWMTVWGLATLMLSYSGLRLKFFGSLAWRTSAMSLCFQECNSYAIYRLMNFECIRKTTYALSYLTMISSIATPYPCQWGNYGVSQWMALLMTLIWVSGSHGPAAFPVHLHESWYLLCC